MPAETGRHQQLIETLGLQPHPEGGHFGEVFRASQQVRVVAPEPRSSPGRPVDASVRSAVTTIYFLLDYPEFSHWHVVGWDEIWHFYEGDPLELWMIDPANLLLHRRILGPLGPEQSPVIIVPAGFWQAARPVSGFTLAGCTVAPGFEFQDFSLVRDDPFARRTIEKEFGSLAELL